MPSLLRRIEKELPRLSEAERKIGTYVLKHPELVPSMTTKDLSAQADASEASVVRFCKSIGLTSFRLFKLELMKDVSAKKPRITNFSSLQEKDTAYNLFQKVTYANQTAIESTLGSLDRKELEKAVGVLAKASRVIFFGVGGSAAAAYDGSYKFTRIGYQASSHHDFHYMLSIIPFMKASDVFIAISLSGKTKDVVELASFAKSKGVTLIAITNMERSPLYKLAGIRLCTPSVEEDFRIGTISSRMTQLNIIDTLYLSVFHESSEEVVQAFTEARERAVKLRR
ncbi:MurR/RpiR family transcriptional regulator [Shouchella shacheensis]|uniref:MurR/RpiR family transcriptional regulator n=1 Tax=Shouchella shacheensis TaxID=1649580 RepID=UPI00073FE5E8|nr:MurR/RpiR family transcriptional regulator [Shouchella shacheensis]